MAITVRVCDDVILAEYRIYSEPEIVHGIISVHSPTLNKIL